MIAPHQRLAWQKIVLSLWFWFDFELSIFSNGYGWFSWFSALLLFFCHLPRIGLNIYEMNLVNVFHKKLFRYPTPRIALSVRSSVGGKIPTASYMAPSHRCFFSIFRWNVMNFSVKCFVFLGEIFWISLWHFLVKWFVLLVEWFCISRWFFLDFLVIFF